LVLLTAADAAAAAWSGATAVLAAQRQFIIVSWKRLKLVLKI
jgi:hypothetical protein